MNEFEKKLVEALRSGKYKQGRRKLRVNETQFCCLGVACDISGVGEWEEIGTDKGYFYRTSDDKGSRRGYGTLPLPVIAKLGWSTDNGKFGLPYYSYCLTDLNDNGFTFDQIADIIEAGLIAKEEANEGAEI